MKVSNVYDIIETLSNVKINNIRYDSPYYFLGDSVPRVTAILSNMIHDDYLLGWANNLGWKHKSHKKESEIAAMIGTHTHTAIEEFLKTGSRKYFKTIDTCLVSYKSVNAFNSFLKYWDMINSNNNVDILGSEIELICPYFGGTCDALLRINDKTYVYDFKTSNHVSYKYILQLVAYKYILENYCYIPIDGICILQLSKDCDDWYWEYILHDESPMDKDLMDKALEFFFTLAQGYMYRMYYEEEYSYAKRKKQWN